MVIKLRQEDIAQALGVPETDLPKYAAPLLNLANRYAQGTRPNIVGQMSELIEEFPGGDVETWAEWYLDGHPEGIEDAVERISKMLASFREVLDEIDEAVIREWVHDLVVYKTYQGMLFQNAILERMAAEVGTDWTAATTEDEARGVDGYVGDKPVSIKPGSYDSQDALPEHIEAVIVTYEKIRGGIEFEFEPADFE